MQIGINTIQKILIKITLECFYATNNFHGENSILLGHLSQYVNIEK